MAGDVRADDGSMSLGGSEAEGVRCGGRRPAARPGHSPGERGRNEKRAAAEQLDWDRAIERVVAGLGF
jgi:hypothetical protein